MTDDGKQENKPFRFAELYIPEVKQAIKDIYDGERPDQQALTIAIARGIAKKMGETNGSDET